MWSARSGCRLRLIFLLIFGVFGVPCSASPQQQQPTHRTPPRTAATADPLSEDELVSSLTLTTSDSERIALLDRKKDLITAKLLNLLMVQGDRLELSGDYPKALNAYNSAARVAEQLADQAGLASAYVGMAVVQIRTADYVPAQANCQKSLEIAEKLGNRELAANALNYLGATQVLRGDPVSSLESYSKALRLVESDSDSAALPRILNNISATLINQGQHAQAREYLQRALVLYEHKDDFRGHAKILRSFGILERDEDNFSRALEYYQEALVLAEKAKDENGVAYLLTDIGDIFNEMGNFGEAVDYFRRAIEFAEKRGAKGGLAWMLETTANAEEHQNNHAAALRDYRKALALAEESEDKGRVAGVLWDLGEASSLHGEYTAALDFHLRSLALAEKLGFQRPIDKACRSVSLDYYHQGKFEEALEFAERVLRGPRTTGDREEFLWADTYAGMAHRALGHDAQARAAFEEAISTAEAMRSDLPGAQDRPLFFSDRITPYREMVTLLVAEDHRAEALTFAEQAKGKALLDLLQSRKIRITKSMTPAEGNQEEDLQAQLVLLNRQISAEKAVPKPNLGRVAELGSEIDKARLRYSEFRANLYAAHPELRSQRGQIEPISLSDAANLLPDGRSALLEFLVAEEKTYLFVLRKSASGNASLPRLEVYKINISAKDLARKAERFRQQLSARDLQFGASAARLYDLLLRPAQAQVSGINSLLIVPDGPLWNLPFQALRPRAGHYLLEDYAISYAPSLTILREMVRLRLRHDQTPSPAGPHTLLAMGNPILANTTSERAKMTYRNQSLAPLPEAAKEVRALETLYGKPQSQIFVGAEAAEDRFKAQAGEFKILHLATHGLLNDSNPMYSHLLLSPGNPMQDGLLEAREIMDLDLHADMAVLSACETARGQITPGEGVIGLSWSFFVAGVPTTVVSQWNVESSSTAELMLAFHSSLKAEHAKTNSTFSTARALQHAELQLLRTQRYSHPFYWAGFIVMGDAR